MESFLISILIGLGIVICWALAIMASIYLEERFQISGERHGTCIKRNECTEVCGIDCWH